MPSSPVHKYRPPHTYIPLPSPLSSPKSTSSGFYNPDTAPETYNPPIKELWGELKALRVGQERSKTVYLPENNTFSIQRQFTKNEQKISSKTIAVLLLKQLNLSIKEGEYFDFSKKSLCHQIKDFLMNPASISENDIINEWKTHPKSDIKYWIALLYESPDDDDRIFQEMKRTIDPK